MVLELIQGFKKWLEDDKSKSICFLVLLFIPFGLWWLSTEKALTKTGLVGHVFFDKTNTVDAIAVFTKKVQEFPGSPVITVQPYDNGNTETRLVVRTMHSKEIINEVVTPFVFPAIMGLLFGAWIGVVFLHSVPNIRKIVKTNTYTLLLWLNGIALVYHFGFSRVVEAILK